MSQPTDGLGQHEQSDEVKESKPRKSVRQRIFLSVLALVFISLLGSSLSLYRISEVSKMLDSMNRVAVPLGRVFAQTVSDAGVFKLEFDRSFDPKHWGTNLKDPLWKPKPLPTWIVELIDSELKRLSELLSRNSFWSELNEVEKWNRWISQMSSQFLEIRQQSQTILQLLEARDLKGATEHYPGWNIKLETWIKQLEWGSAEYDRSLRKVFSMTEMRTRELRTGLELVLIVVVALSLLMLWLGEKALRPLAELTRLAREITRRGLRKEDKTSLPDIRLTRDDEVSHLAREFHNMATSLLEREKVVESQKTKLQEQNHLLREIGTLNDNILSSMKSALIVTDLDAKITQCNLPALKLLMSSAKRSQERSQAGEYYLQQVLGTTLYSWETLRVLLGKEAQQDLVRRPDIQKIEPKTISGRIFGGQVLPLRTRALDASPVAAVGAIIVIEDLTEEYSLQERLKTAEQLAAIGRLSAQVAHEVRNPLHSLGLEAELALEILQKPDEGYRTSPKAIQSLQSILMSVDRLEKVTDNYLKLSRQSLSRYEKLNLAEILQSVLAIYATEFESYRIALDWELLSVSRESRIKSGQQTDHQNNLQANLQNNPQANLQANPQAKMTSEEKSYQSTFSVLGDSLLLEQVIANFLRNSIQALQEVSGVRKIVIKLWKTENQKVWFEIKDTGLGVPGDFVSKLFSPFSTTKAQGTGLGLSHVKKVIEDHGGQVQYLGSEVPLALGVFAGATFRFCLPEQEGLSCHQFIEPAIETAFAVGPS